MKFAVNDNVDIIIEYLSKGFERLFYGLKNDGSYYSNNDAIHAKIINIEKIHIDLNLEISLFILIKNNI